MADYIIQDTTLTAIADAIREKAGGTAALTPAAMVTAIEGIETGGGLPDGISAIASGTFTPTSNITSRYSVAHGLGVIPNFFIVTVVGSFTYGSAFVSSYFVRANHTDSGNNKYIGTQQQRYLNGSKGSASSSSGITAISNVADSTNIIVPAFSSGRLLSGVEYRWIAGVIDGLN